jgi:hypothetical protein
MPCEQAVTMIRWGEFSSSTQECAYTILPEWACALEIRGDALLPLMEDKKKKK